MCQARSLAPSQPQGIPRLPAAVVGATSTHGLCSPHKVQHRTQGWGYSLGLDGVAGEAQPLTPSTQPEQNPCAWRGTVGCCRGRRQWGRTPNQGMSLGVLLGAQMWGAALKGASWDWASWRCLGLGRQWGVSSECELSHAHSKSSSFSWACPAVSLPQGCPHPCPGCGHPHVPPPWGLPRHRDP